MLISNLEIIIVNDENSDHNSYNCESDMWKNLFRLQKIGLNKMLNLYFMSNKFPVIVLLSRFQNCLLCSNEVSSCIISRKNELNSCVDIHTLNKTIYR